MAQPSNLPLEGLSATLQAEIMTDEKNAQDLAQHAELEKNAIVDGAIIKSPFEDLSFIQTLRTFRKASLIAMMAAFTAAAE